MPFKPGQPKISGRRPGSKNKVPSDLKARIAALVEGQFENVQAKLEQLDAKEYMTAYIKLLEFVISKQRDQRIDLSNLNEQQIDDLLKKALTIMSDEENR